VFTHCPFIFFLAKRAYNVEIKRYQIC